MVFPFIVFGLSCCFELFVGMSSLLHLWCGVSQSPSTVSISRARCRPLSESRLRADLALTFRPESSLPIVLKSVM